jgi:hypothetical protein
MSGRQLTAAIALALAGTVAVQAFAPSSRVTLRGCLTGSTLTHVDPRDPPRLELPDKLRVTSIRVIRDQVKALDNHQVEVIGTLHDVPGQESQENGLLVVDSDKGKLYLGGGDPRLGQDLAPPNPGSPRIHADTIKDLAAACTAIPPG